MTSRLDGVFTALGTPFEANGRFDESTMRRLVERQIAAGVRGLVPCGTTGEAAAMTADEHEQVVRAVRGWTREKYPAKPATMSGLLLARSDHVLKDLQGWDEMVNLLQQSPPCRGHEPVQAGEIKDAAQQSYRDNAGQMVRRDQWDGVGQQRRDAD